MNFSSIRTDKNNKVHVATRSAKWFLQAFTSDTGKGEVGNYRYNLTTFPTSKNSEQYEQMTRICAPCELRVNASGDVEVKHFNGVVVLEVHNVGTEAERAELKRKALHMPPTLAACVGADERTVVLMVCTRPEQGELPQDEAEAADYYARAYRHLLPVYDGVLGRQVARMEPQLRYSFLRPLDETPLFNEAAVPYVVSGVAASGTDTNDEHLLTTTEPARSQQQMDIDAYAYYERLYTQATQHARIRLTNVPRETPEWWQRYIASTAAEMAGMGVPEAETATHISHHIAYVPEAVEMGIETMFVQTLVASIYAERATIKGSADTDDNMMMNLIRRMEACYQLRHNTIMGYTEYRPNDSWVKGWQPVTDKVINTFTTDLQIAGIKVWDRDVKRYVNSNHVPDYSPIISYLYDECDGKWDGRDRIRQLALTVPTDIPEKWAEWFHTWFLGMVAMWTGRSRNYGNSIMPLLVSKQGMHKSTFCRNLLPPVLSKWGYNDNLSLSDERQVHLAMAQMLLINLDEFNRISPAKQQGFLKNILQLPSVKVKRPYARHTEDVPRLASFIATTNMADVLTDPTGSRRFIGIQVTGDIDVSAKPNHQQLYAQALHELSNGARYWLNESETAELMEHNLQFQQYRSEVQAIMDIFEPVAEDDPRGQWLTAAAMCQQVKAIMGNSIKLTSLRSIGRELCNLPTLLHKRVNIGNVYRVALRNS